ncbi:hypothetical protein NKH28_31870 [Mesorhizobium sp. M1227]|uniref:hypothetical protein n=1 Tax=Mesorhizobium sp. M1227 TaxID=2957071 RepID=UPI0033359763
MARAVWVYFRFNLSLRNVEEMPPIEGSSFLRDHPPMVPKHGPDYARRIPPQGANKTISGTG